MTDKPQDQNEWPQNISSIDLIDQFKKGASQRYNRVSLHMNGAWEGIYPNMVVLYREIKGRNLLSVAERELGVTLWYYIRDIREDVDKEETTTNG